MSSTAQARLAEERKIWRKDHPVGFVAKPETRNDGSVDLFTWKCLIPGQEGTTAEGGKFPTTIRFTQHYPQKPPLVYMPNDFLHINVFDGGQVCLSILKEEVPDHLGNVPGWCASYSVKQILVAVQELISNPNPGSVASTRAYDIWARSRAEYDRRMREQAAKYSKDEDE